MSELFPDVESPAGLDMPRHRLFECSFALLTQPCSHRRGKTLGVYGHGTNAWHREKMGRNITMSERKEALGIDWMRRGEDSEAIPPAYTQFIGEQLMRHIAFPRERGNSATLSD